MKLQYDNCPFRICYTSVEQKSCIMLLGTLTYLYDQCSFKYCDVAFFGYETSEVSASCKSNNIIRDVVTQCDGNVVKVYNDDRLLLRATWGDSGSSCSG